MKKFFGKLLLITAAVVLCAFGFIACRKGVVIETGGGGNDKTQLPKLAAVDGSSIKVDYDISTFAIGWDAVENAEFYALTVNGFKTSVGATSVDMRTQIGFTLPLDGTFRMTLVAKAEGYADSDQTTITYNAEGYALKSPEIKSFNSNVLEWNAVSGATAYLLKINGTPVSDGSDGYIHATKFDLSDYRTQNIIGIELSAVGDDVYFKSSAVLSLKASFAENRLCMLPVTEYVLENSVLKWEAVGGATEYRVVDINYNVTRVEETSYDMSDKNLVIGVFPVSESTVIGDAVTENLNIKYLDGEGTESSPYLIKTPFDLRAIDYYELLYGKTRKNRYRIENDIDYDTVAALDEESNIYMLTQPFYGVLDGNGKTLSGIRVRYDGGYWALFDFIVKGATVKNVKFDGANIVAELQNKDYPLNAAIATVAHKNSGTITGVTVSHAEYSASGGAVCGIAYRNDELGIVENCTVSGKFTQADTGLYSQACYEMAGVVVENWGTVSGNRVTQLTLSGDVSASEVWESGELKGYSYYNNARTAAGIVAVNRAGGTVSDNSYTSLTMSNMLNYYKGAGAYEFGGIVAYNAGTVVKGSASFGSFTWSTSTADGKKLSVPITHTISTAVGWQASDGEVGETTDFRGTVCGKSDGTVR